jgi:hypothetical protein
MEAKKQGARSLREMEEEVLEEGREWMRKRLEKKLQEEANRHGGVFPPQRKKRLARTKKADAATDQCRLD